MVENLNGFKNLNEIHVNRSTSNDVTFSNKTNSISSMLNAQLCCFVQIILKCSQTNTTYFAIFVKSVKSEFANKNMVFRDICYFFYGLIDLPS